MLLSDGVKKDNITFKFVYLQLEGNVLLFSVFCELIMVIDKSAFSTIHIFY